MSSETETAHANFLSRELDWLTAVIAHRMELFASDEGKTDLLAQIVPPPLPKESGPYADFLKSIECSAQDRLLIVLALAPVISPATLDMFLTVNQQTGHRFSEFGGRFEEADAKFVPTLRTAIFILAGTDIRAKLDCFEQFATSVLLSEGIMREDLALEKCLDLTDHAGDLILRGGRPAHTLSADFPATALRTAFEWDDLVLSESTQREIEQLLQWARHRDTLVDDWGLGKRIGRGYRALFHGPPGTGKTLTAALMGKVLERPVLQVDLSLAASADDWFSHLGQIFDQAERQDWILFFDEADALFARRGNRDHSNDRRMAAATGYLLQRMESFDGLLIVSGRMHPDLDAAFMRRFQSLVRFAMPDANHRLMLWRNNFLDKPFAVSNDIDWEEIARDYEVSAAQIIDILRFCALRAVEREEQEITKQDVLQGIKRELALTGRLTHPADADFLWRD